MSEKILTEEEQEQINGGRGEQLVNSDLASDLTANTAPALGNGACKTVGNVKLSLTQDGNPDIRPGSRR